MKKRTDTPATIAVIYARYSSHRQWDVSIEQQIEECEAYAAANNLSIVETYADRAISGKTDMRPEFQRMIRNAERKKFQVIVAYKSNRIARNMLNALAYEDKLEKYGVRILYVKEEFGDNAAGRFALRTMMNVNQFYVENMAEDIRRGLRDNATRCIVNTALPLGYRKGADGRYEIIESEAEIVREIFARVFVGEPFVDIARSLNDRGRRTKQGKEWGSNSFHRITSNQRYIGVYEYADVRIEDGIPAIIDKEMFYAVNEKLTTKKNPQGRHRVTGDYLLTGKLFCGRCNSPMVGVSGTGKSGALFYYYQCQGNRQHKGCEKRPVRCDVAERLVAETIRQYILQDNVIDWIADTVIEYKKSHAEYNRIAALQAQMDEVTKAKRNIVAAIEQGIITPTTKSRLVEFEGE